MRRAALAALAWMIAGMLPGTAVASGDPAFGYWMVESGKAVVAIEPCGPGACGRLVWLAEPVGEDGRVKRDANNPDPALRRRPLCGIELISGLEPAQRGEWTGGAIYDGRDGSVYDVEIRAADADTLEVRGYVGLTLFGASQTWTRVGHDRGGCDAGRTAAR